jgi:hypothetical protein
MPATSPFPKFAPAPAPAALLDALLDLPPELVAAQVRAWLKDGDHE